MLKLAFTALVMTGLVSVGPVFADTNSGGNGGIGRGCTLDPFNHTMRCIDFDNCTIDKNGKKTCPVVVTPTKAEASGGGKKADKQQYLVVKMESVLVTSY